MPEINPESVAPKKRYSSGKFYNCASKVNEKYMTVQLPASLAKYINAKDKVFFHVGNGVIQISGSEPKTAIPMMVEEEFQDQ